MFVSVVGDCSAATHACYVVDDCSAAMYVCFVVVVESSTAEHSVFGG